MAMRPARFSTARSRRWDARPLRRAARCNASDDVPSEPPPLRNQLEVTIKRKQKAIQALIEELGTDRLEEQLQDAVSVPSKNPYRLGHIIQEYGMRSQITLIAEVPRLRPSEVSSELARRAQALERAGADALSVKTDSYDTPTGLQDLFVVVQAVKCPVLQRDWFLHPLQLVAARDAGAAGVLGVVAQVSGRGTPVMSSFASTLGLDAPVEVVNMAEVTFLASAEVPTFALNCSVKLSLPIPGFAADMTKALLAGLPFGAPSVVGVRSLEEAKTAAMNGASCLLVKSEWLEEHLDEAPMAALFEELRYAVSFDD